MKNVLQDCGKALLIGLVCGAALGGLFFLIGLLTGGGTAAGGAEGMKNGLLLLCALGMFVTAGMLLMSGKKQDRFAGKDGWRKHFHVIGYKTAVILFSIALLLLASAADFLTRVIGTV